MNMSISYRTLSREMRIYRIAISKFIYFYFFYLFKKIIIKDRERDPVGVIARDSFSKECSNLPYFCSHEKLKVKIYHIFVLAIGDPILIQ